MDFLIHGLAPILVAAAGVVFFCASCKRRKVSITKQGLSRAFFDCASIYIFGMLILVPLISPAHSMGHILQHGFGEGEIFVALVAGFFEATLGFAAITGLYVVPHNGNEATTPSEKSD